MIVSSIDHNHLAFHYLKINITQLDCNTLTKHQYLPTLPMILKEFGNIATIIVSISCLLTLTIICIFIEEMVYLYHRWPLRTYCTTIGILAVFPISSTCFFLTLLMPRAHDVNTTMATLYQPLSLVLFYKLIASYSGREKNLQESLLNKKIPTKGPPFYWFCICFPPNMVMNKKLFHLMKVCIYQLFMAPCFLYFAMGVCTKTGVYVAGQYSLENAAIYIVTLGAISFCIGIYWLEVLYKMCKCLLPGYYICSKYYILQSYFVITRFNVLFFDTLGSNDFLPCLPPISAFAYGLYLRTLLLIISSFVLSIMARHIFGKASPNGKCSNDHHHHHDGGGSKAIFESITDSIT